MDSSGERTARRNSVGAPLMVLASTTWAALSSERTVDSSKTKRSAAWAESVSPVLHPVQAGLAAAQRYLVKRDNC
jgi:hypothetical protein